MIYIYDMIRYIYIYMIYELDPVGIWFSLSPGAKPLRWTKILPFVLSDLEIS